MSSKKRKKQKNDEVCLAHEHEHEHEENTALGIALTVAAALVLIASLAVPMPEKAESLLQVISAALSGCSVAISAVKSALHKKINESTLSVIAIVAALAIGEFFEAAAVALFFRIGELLEDYASDKSRKSIESLCAIVSDRANVVKGDGSVESVDAEGVEVGTRIVVLPHEIVPLDAVVTDGAGAVDSSALTGEALPVSVEKGFELRSGMINGSNALYAVTTAPLEGSAAARIVKMVEAAAEKKSDSQRMISTFARYYTPIVVACAFSVAIVMSLITGDWSKWIYRGLVFLVASCPCAVVLSAPLAFFASMGECARNGMIIKGSRYIEALARADAAAFDKTGTLTTGALSVEKITPAEGFDDKRVLHYAALCEHFSQHPAARAICAAAGETDCSAVSGFNEIAGMGTSAMLGAKQLLCGGSRLMERNSVDISTLPAGQVYVALAGRAIGSLELGASVREDAPPTVARLKRLGFEKLVMLTGDSGEQARAVSEKCALTDCRHSLLPEGKLEELEKIVAGSKGAIYVGDGINDSPSLALADVGVAMGLGTRAASEAADVILTDSSLARLADAVVHSRRTMAVLKFNIAFSIGVKIVVMLLGLLGIAPIWSAVFADVGTMIIAVLNSSRLLRVRRLTN